VEDGHEVHVAYMTSGNIAVFDHDAARIADLVTEYNRLFGIDEKKSKRGGSGAQRIAGRKQPGEARRGRRCEDQGADPLERSEAGAMKVGLPRRAPALSRPAVLSHRHGRQEAGRRGGRADHPRVDRTRAADQIYVAGDLSDPHGTHRVCAEAIFRALARSSGDGPTPEVLLYRGAWQEYELHEIEIAVPSAPATCC
jgi:glucosamine-6-phosphate deaminase